MIILASASSRRVDLLKDAGIDFKVIPSKVEESIDTKLSPSENAMNVALKKAKEVYSNNPGTIVVAADTIVVLNNEIFGKPKDEEDAFNMLSALSGKKHDVITGVAIIHDDKEDVFYSKTAVKFKELSESVINDYIATKEPFGKAGGYAIQGLGKEIVETYEGDFLTIVGLPLMDVVKRLNAIKNSK